MDKHQFRILEHENMQLRSQVFYLNGILDKIEDWLEGESTLKCNPDTEPMAFGRISCADFLLEQIKKWESEDE